MVVSGLLLAVDGGASKTEVAIVDVTGAVCGRALGPASNHQMVGIDKAIENLRTTIAEAADQAGVETTRVATMGVFCLAGLDLPIDHQRLAPAIEAAGWVTEAHLFNDAFAVFRAGSTGPIGVGLVCGTGLNCVAVAPDGSTVRFPSLGELSGDFTPGGIWLGIRALGLALRSGDGRGSPTALRDTVPAHFDLASPEAVLEAIYTGVLSYGRLAELAPVLLDAAAAGDTQSDATSRLLVDEALAMVRVGVAGVQKGGGSAPVDVVAGGGLFKHSWFAGLFEDLLVESLPEADLRTLPGPPVLGAALLVLDRLPGGSVGGVFERARRELAGV